MKPQDPRFVRAIALIDAANGEDPREERDEAGAPQPRELLYSRRMTEMLERYVPEASDAMRLAVRAQHIERWKSPRERYPMDRAGYLRWRAELYQLHAGAASRVMREAGYDEGTIARVAAAVGKKGLKTNPDTQLLEDVASLVFIEHYMAPFAGQKPDYSVEKWLDITRKILRKMSAEARGFALSGKARVPAPLRPLLEQAAHELLRSSESTDAEAHHAGKAEGH